MEVKGYGGIFWATADIGSEKKYSFQGHFHNKLLCLNYFLPPNVQYYLQKGMLLCSLSHIFYNKVGLPDPQMDRQTDR